MAENLFLRISATDSGDNFLEWMLLDETSGIIRFRGEGSEADYKQSSENLTFSGKAVVYISSEQVLLTDAVVPTRQPRQILQAIPYMVEEQLACDVELCHFAIGQRSDSGAVSVAVVDQSHMQALTELLADLGVKPNVLTIDLFAVPFEETCSVLLEADRALIRTGRASGLAVPISALATTIGFLTDEERQSIHLNVLEEQAENLSLQIDQLNAELEEPVDVSYFQHAPFESLCRNFEADGINLLQGSFKVEAESKSGSTPWRSVAILAACAFTLHLFVVMGQAVYLDMEAQRLDSETRALYSEIYPKDRNVRDLRRRWQNHLRGGGSREAGDFMSLFVETTKHIPGTNLTLNNLNYNDSRGDLVLQLEATRSEQLIAFADTLIKMGLTAEIGTINQADSAVRGSVKVKMEAGA